VLADIVTREVPVPTIGIGAGNTCDGQVLVFHDVLGMGGGNYPKFVRTYADLRTASVEALRSYAADVENGAFPAEAETYHMADDIAEALLGALGG
jgi:3-methyl-2-oxobutanoate hydroxymethyltransferase